MESGQGGTTSRAGIRLLQLPVPGLICGFPCDTHANVAVTQAKHLARAFSPGSIPVIFYLS